MKSAKVFFQNRVVLLITTIIIIGLAFLGGTALGMHRQYGKDEAVQFSSMSSSTPSADLTLFWSVWNILDQKYVATHASTSDTTQGRVYGAIQGMVASLGDPYTVFFPPSDAAIFNSEISGNFEGIGLEVGVKNGVLVAVAPLKGSPAEKAGIKSGDIIAKINGQATDNMTVDEAVKNIRGDKGTTVTLTLLRAGKTDPFDVKIVRDTINEPTVDTIARNDGIFVIKLYQFSENSPDLFRNALRQFVLSGDHKLILDLRGNPGGYLDAAVDMASWFLPGGDVVVKESYGSGKPDDVYKSLGYNIFNSNLKMIILVDGGSASASEILSGALSEQGVAKLVGEKTFGKGSVQELVPLDNNSALKVTVARWLTPNGLSISGNGITPDVTVAISDADVLAGKDPQMQKAVDILGQSQ
jgi:carboxyl-terminal processing protease